MPWPWPLTYFKVKVVAGRGTTILRICLFNIKVQYAATVHNKDIHLVLLFISCTRLFYFVDRFFFLFYYLVRTTFVHFVCRFFFFSTISCALFFRWSFFLLSLISDSNEIFFSLERDNFSLERDNFSLERDNFSLKRDKKNHLNVPLKRLRNCGIFLEKVYVRHKWKFLKKKIV